MLKSSRQCIGLTVSKGFTANQDTLHKTLLDVSEVLVFTHVFRQSTTVLPGIEFQS